MLFNPHLITGILFCALYFSALPLLATPRALNDSIKKQPKVVVYKEGRLALELNGVERIRYVYDGE